MRSRERKKMTIATSSVLPVGRQDVMRIVAHQEKRRATSEPDSEERSVHLTWNANIFSTYQVNSAVLEHQFGRNEVLIDI